MRILSAGVAVLAAVQSVWSAQIVNLTMNAASTIAFSPDGPVELPAGSNYGGGISGRATFHQTGGWEARLTGAKYDCGPGFACTNVPIAFSFDGLLFKEPAVILDMDGFLSGAGHGLLSITITGAFPTVLLTGQFSGNNGRFTFGDITPGSRFAVLPFLNSTSIHVQGELLIQSLSAGGSMTLPDSITVRLLDMPEPASWALAACGLGLLALRVAIR